MGILQSQTRAFAMTSASVSRSTDKARTHAPKRIGLLFLMSLLASLLFACAGQDRRLGEAAPASPAGPEYKPGDKVAVLLPQRGYFAQAAQAVKDGLLAAQSSSAESDRLALHFYDATDAADVLTILDRAAADGATLAIGPLHRDAVARLAGVPRLPITTLALNDSEGGRLPPQNLYRFALSPEDEAEEVARAAKAKGFSSALVIYPEGDWGSRIAKSFIAGWEAVGGVVEAGQMYDPDTSTFDEPLEKLFQTAQYATSASGLGTGADLIFFVGTEQALRAIRPQIRAVAADRLPVFTTSHVNASGFDALRANGLVGIYFVDIPWMVSAQSLPPSLSQYRRATRSRSVDDQRLFALGLDAYRLAPIITRQPTQDTPVLGGQTGTLRVDDERRIRRRLVPVRVESWGFAVQK
jgi:outer membrane PBP1 activator LpoA protein